MKLSILHDGSVDKCHASAFNALIRYSDECKLFWNTGYTCKQDIHINYKQIMLTILSSITFFLLTLFQLQYILFLYLPLKLKLAYRSFYTSSLLHTVHLKSKLPPAGRGVEFVGCRPAEW